MSMTSTESASDCFKIWGENYYSCKNPHCDEVFTKKIVKKGDHIFCSHLCCLKVTTELPDTLDLSKGEDLSDESIVTNELKTSTPIESVVSEPTRTNNESKKQNNQVDQSSQPKAQDGKVFTCKNEKCNKVYYKQRFHCYEFDFCSYRCLRIIIDLIRGKEEQEANERFIKEKNIIHNYGGSAVF